MRLESRPQGWRRRFALALLALGWSTLAAAAVQPPPAPQCACGEANVCCRLHQGVDCHDDRGRESVDWKCPLAPLGDPGTPAAWPGLPRSLPALASLAPPLAGPRLATGAGSTEQIGGRQPATPPPRSSRRS